MDERINVSHPFKLYRDDSVNAQTINKESHPMEGKNGLILRKGIAEGRNVNQIMSILF
jgi:hypothetical protein